jgi:hypothetical protein
MYVPVQMAAARPTAAREGTVRGSASSKLSQPVSKLPCDHDTFTRPTKIEEAREGRGAKKALLKATRSKKPKVKNLLKYSLGENSI